MKRLSSVLVVSMIISLFVLNIIGIIQKPSQTQTSIESTPEGYNSQKKFDVSDEDLIPPKIQPNQVSSSESSSEESSSEEKKTTTKKKTTKKVSSEESSSEIDVSSEESSEESNLIKIGRCRLTIYTPYESGWGYTTATGVISEHLKTCAVDPKVIPYGSTIILKANGNEWRLKAVDCGNFRGRMIDVFYDGTVSAGVSWLIEMFGAEYAEVWIER